MLARALTGLAAGTLSTCSITFAADWFAYNVRGRAIGLISSAYFAAPILGVPIAAQIADRFGWRRAFLFFAGLAVAAAVTLRLPRERLNPALHGKVASGRPRFSLLSGAARYRRRAGDCLPGVRGLVGFLTYIGEWLNSRFGLPTRTIGWVFMLGGIVAVGSAPLGGIFRTVWGNAPCPSPAISCWRWRWLRPVLVLGIGLLVVFALASLGAAFRRALDRADDGNGARGAARLLHRLAEYFFADGHRHSRLPGRIAVKVRLRGGNHALRGHDGRGAVLLTTHIVEPQPIEERA